jgi:hypothetical protein
MPNEDPVKEACKKAINHSEKKQDETQEIFSQRIKDEFESAVKTQKHSFRGKPVIFNTEKDSDGLMGSFSHVTTSQKNEFERREFDIERFEKCAIIFAILDNCDSIRCQCLTIKKDYNGEPHKISVYCSEYRYVLILKETKFCYYLVTSFPVTKENEEKYC